MKDNKMILTKNEARQLINHMHGLFPSYIKEMIKIIRAENLKNGEVNNDGYRIKE